MLKTNDHIDDNGISYWKIFRIIFIVFSLYLLKDVFYRWDGFKYHSTFAEFIPSVALVTIFWSMLATLAAGLIWFLLRGTEYLCRLMKWKIKVEFLLVFAGISLVLIVFALIGKPLVTKAPIPITSKLVVAICILLVSIYLTWNSRNNFYLVYDRITPLVWLFGLWLIISVPIVGYHTWLKQPTIHAPKKNAQSSTSKTERPNIILVSFDSLTALDMSVYGYKRPTTPFIERWSDNTSLFSRFQSASNWTSSSTASMMTGKRVWTHWVFQGDSKLLKSNTESLPLILKNNGYYNMAFVANGYASVKRLGVDNAFHIAPRNTELGKSRTLVGIRFGMLDIILSRFFSDKIKSYSWIIFPDFILGKFLREHFLYSAQMSQTEAPPESAFNYFINHVDSGIPGPFFAWIHLYPPHDPYLPDEPYMGMFDSSSKLRSFNKQMEDEVEAHKVKNDKDWDIYRARYDEFIRYCDKQFEDFINEWSKRALSENTIIIFTSDHGESFEHNYFTHNSNYHYEQVTHIPLIIKEPHIAGGGVINELTDQIDLAPTILDLAGIAVPSWMEGSSLVPLMRGKIVPPKHVYSMSFQKNPSTGEKITKGTIAVWEGNYKLIHYLEDNKSLLFNLERDPDELNNLINDHPEIGRHLLALIQENLNNANERSGMESTLEER